MSEMTISEAIEVLKVIRQPENLKKMVYFNYEDGNQALDKAIEVMEAYIQIGNVKPYMRTIK